MFRSFSSAIYERICDDTKAQCIFANSNFLSQKFAFSDVVDEFVDVVTLESEFVEGDDELTQTHGM